MMATQRERQAIAAGVFIGRVRSIQSAHYRAHAALTNWGDWSADRKGIYPRLKPPSVWDQFKRDENEEYGEVKPEDERGPAVAIQREPPKAEAAEKKAYNELEAIQLDERIHGYGGLPVEIRHALRAAYVTREVPEEQFPAASGCSEDAFCERLTAALDFVGRFA